MESDRSADGTAIVRRRRIERWQSNTSGAPGEARTPDLLLRRQTLYPTELRARSLAFDDSTTPAIVIRDPSTDDLLVGEPGAANHEGDPDWPRRVGNGGCDILGAANLLAIDAHEEIAGPDANLRSGRIRAHSCDSKSAIGWGSGHAKP